jgi:succinate-acetate transporter protein
MKARGRPVLGGFAGFFFFLFLAIDLLAFGVIPSNSPLLTVLPVLGILLGIAWAYWAPLGSRASSQAPAPPPQTF